MTFHKIIAGYEGAEPSHDALRFAAVVAEAAGAELIVAHVSHYDGHHMPGAADLRLQIRARAARRLEEAEALLPYGVRATMRAVESRSPVQGLHDLAEVEGADLIVVGSTTKGALELHAVGSVPERLLRGAPCAVAVAPRGFASDANPGLRVIGVAYDGSDEARAALHAACDLAQATGACINLIGVAEHPPVAAVGLASMYTPVVSAAAYRESMQHELERVADELPHELRPQVLVSEGEPVHEILERAECLSLLVMGSRGYGPFRRALLGSVSGPVLRGAPCPVVVVPRGAPESVSRASSRPQSTRNSSTSSASITS